MEFNAMENLTQAINELLVVFDVVVWPLLIISGLTTGVRS